LEEYIFNICLLLSTLVWSSW